MSALNAYQITHILLTMILFNHIIGDLNIYTIYILMAQSCSYVWVGSRGCGKRTQLRNFLQEQCTKIGVPFEIKHSTWFLNKQINNGDPDDDTDDSAGKSIPYEESLIHLGYDVATMSMSDKVFLQSILTRWTGQQDILLLTSTIHSRYLVLYHAHYLTDESVLQLQECLEQYSTFTILLTSELPLCSRLRNFCLEIPVVGKDYLLENYNKENAYIQQDVWLDFFKITIDKWSSSWSVSTITDIRNWIYTCLQRNLRWTDVIMYWILAIYNTPWITASMRSTLLRILWHAESGAGWLLLPSYRIPIMWEHVHLTLAVQLFQLRKISL
jgi:hypothetical protein